MSRSSFCSLSPTLGRLEMALKSFEAVFRPTVHGSVLLCCKYCGPTARCKEVRKCLSLRSIPPSVVGAMLNRLSVFAVHFSRPHPSFQVSYLRFATRLLCGLTLLISRRPLGVVGGATSCISRGSCLVAENLSGMVLACRSSPHPQLQKGMISPRTST